MNKPIALEVKLNGISIVNEDAKQFIDYLSDTIVRKNTKALTKRNIYAQTLELIYRLAMVIILFKYFPEIIQIFTKM